jgi:hypothetical protein
VVVEVVVGGPTYAVVVVLVLVDNDDAIAVTLQPWLFPE